MPIGAITDEAALERWLQDRVTGLNANAVLGLPAFIALPVTEPSKVADGVIIGDHLAIESIDATKIVAETITSAQIAAGTITAGNIKAGTITGVLIAGETIEGKHIKAGTISAVSIEAESIETKHLKAEAVVASKIAAGTITANEIAANTITANEIAALTITSAEIASGTITSGQVAAGGILAGNISISELSALSADLGTITAGTVTGATLQTGTVGSRVVIDSEGLRAYDAIEQVLGFDIATGDLFLKGEVKAGSTVPASVVTGELTSAQIKEIQAAKVAGELSGAQIAAESITSAHIVSGTIVAGDIKAGTITANEIKTLTITAEQIALGTILALNIKANTITAGQIAASTITATQIAGETITGAKIAANTITAAKLNVTELSAITASLGTITSGTITSGTFRTSASNPKVIMDAEGLRSISSTGVTQLEIDIGGLNLEGGEATIKSGMTVSWSGSGYVAGYAPAAGFKRLTLFGGAIENIGEVVAATSYQEAPVGNKEATKTILKGKEESSFLQLTAVAKRSINFGTVKLKWTASTNSAPVEVTHGLGVEPTVVHATPLSSPSFGQIPIPNISSKNSTKFSMNAEIKTSSSIEVTMMWTAIG